MNTILQKNCRRIAFAGILFTSLASAFEVRAGLAAINRVPFVSTISLERTVTSGTAPKFKFYVTDFENKDYMKNDTSESFVVNVYLSGSTGLFHTGTYAAGEHEVTLPTLALPSGTTEEEKRIGIQATDSQGRKSDLLVQRFRVVDPGYLVITGSQTLSPSAATLLASFGIYNDGTNPVSTTAGLNQLLLMSSTMVPTIRKVVLPGGTYLISENNTVKIPSRMTLDLNGSTFKLNPNTLNKHIMIEIAKAYDSHVINGTIEGDLATRGYTGASSEDPLGQWITAVQLAQGAEYCSFENLTILNYAGNGANTSIDYLDRVPPHNLSHNNPVTVGTAFEYGEYDEATGGPVASSDRVRTKSSDSITKYDITDFMSSYGFIQLGRFSGYQSNPTDNWAYRASFYNAAQNYIGSEIGYMYRRMYPPTGAKYVRFTLFCAKTTLDQPLSIFNMRYPYNCDFTNIHFENIRCVGMVPSGFNNLHVTGCSWENCGWAAGKSALDSEDGWDCSQHLVFKNNTFGTNPNAEFNGISGHNFVLQDNVMALATGARLGSVVVRNNTLKNATFSFGPFSRSAYPRIYNNTIQGMTNLICSYSESEMEREYLIRDNVLQGGIYTSGTSRAIQRMMYSWSCTFTAGNIQGRVVNSNLTNINTTSTQGAVLGRWCELDGCLVTSSTIKVGGFGNESVIKNSAVASSVINTQGSTLLMISNTIANSSFATPGSAGGGLTDKLHFEGNTISTSGTVVVKAVKGFGSVGFYNNTVSVSNPTCQVLWLKADSGTNTGTYNMDATVCGNTFTGSSTASAVYVAGSGTNTTFRLGLKDNVCNTIALTSGSTSVVTAVAPPSVNLTSPSSGSAGAAPASISFGATASDTDGTISKVEFYDGDKKLGEDLVSPFSLSLSGFPAGSYSFTARAVDNGNTINVSPRTTVTVSP